MKTSPRSLSIRFMLAALAGGLFISGSAHANVSGVNTPAGSFASIQFDDTNSLNPFLISGTTNLTTGTTPWGGTSFTLPLTTDTTTFDFAKGNLNSFFSGPTYGVTLNSVFLRQPLLNSGFALLRLQFDIEFQLDAGGLPLQATLSPTFIANGSVLGAAGSYARLGGNIDYYGITASGTSGLIESVVYGQQWVGAGPFSASVSGFAANGFTPPQPANGTLTLVGNIFFIVDPASIGVETAPVPEPATWALMGLAIPALLGAIRMHKQAARS